MHQPATWLMLYQINKDALNIITLTLHILLRFVRENMVAVEHNLNENSKTNGKELSCDISLFTRHWNEMKILWILGGSKGYWLFCPLLE